MQEGERGEETTTASSLSPSWGLYSFSDLLERVQVGGFTSRSPSSGETTIAAACGSDAIRLGGRSRRFTHALRVRLGIQASEEELRAGLLTLGAVPLDGFWRLIEPVYLGTLLELIISR